MIRSVAINDRFFSMSALVLPCLSPSLSMVLSVLTRHDLYFHMFCVDKEEGNVRFRGQARPRRRWYPLAGIRSPRDLLSIKGHRG